MALIPAVIIQAVLYGLFCTGFGVGLTMIRNIAPYTLKYVFAASFVCGFLYDLFNAFSRLPFTGAFIGAFMATMLIRAAFEKKLVNVYFRIVITSVYCICPGLTLANMFDGMLNTDAAVVMTKALQLVRVGGGIAAGILVCGTVCDRLYGHRVTEEV